MTPFCAVENGGDKYPGRVGRGINRKLVSYKRDSLVGNLNLNTIGAIRGIAALQKKQKFKKIFFETSESVCNGRHLTASMIQLCFYGTKLSVSSRRGIRRWKHSAESRILQHYCGAVYPTRIRPCARLCCKGTRGLSADGTFDTPGVFQDLMMPSRPLVPYFFEMKSIGAISTRLASPTRNDALMAFIAKSILLRLSLETVATRVKSFRCRMVAAMYEIISTSYPDLVIILYLTVR